MSNCSHISSILFFKDPRDFNCTQKYTIDVLMGGRGCMKYIHTHILVIERDLVESGDGLNGDVVEAVQVVLGRCGILPSERENSIGRNTVLTYQNNTVTS